MTPTIRRTFGTNGFGGSVTQHSLGKPPAVYPAAVATDSDMIIAVDRQQTRLALPMSTTDSSMTVVDPSVIVPYSLLTIDVETVKVTGPPAGNVVPILRAFDGTTAAVHLASAVVAGFVDAYHHNRLVAEVEAIEQTLGTNLSRIPASPFIVSTNYIFPPQTPAVPLASGNNVITLSPVPAGVNGTDQNHWLYISGGTGAPEAVLITGGAAVAGAPSGTLIVNCGHAHSGAWTIATATAGIQEAVNTSLAGATAGANTGGGPTVYIPAGTHVVYSPITTVNSSFVWAPIQGVDTSSTTIAPDASFPTLDVMPSSAVFIANCGSGQGSVSFAGPSFIGFTIAFNQPWASITTRTQIKQWRGMDLSNTHDTLVRDVIISEAWNGITYVGTWNGTSWTYPVGRGQFDHVSISAYNIAIKIDGMLDSSRFAHIHLWPFGSFTNYIYDPNAIGFQIGRADDLNITNSMCLSGKGFQFIGGADGAGSFCKITGFDFDGLSGIEMLNTGYTSGGSATVFVSNSYMYFSPSTNPASYHAINYQRGIFQMTGGFIDGANFTVPPILIDHLGGGQALGVFALNGVTILNNACATVKFLQQVNETNTSLQIQIQNCYFVASPQSMSFTAPQFSIEQGASGNAWLTFTGNTFNEVTAPSVALSIATDDYHWVGANRIPSIDTNVPWSMQIPASAVYGHYEKSPNLTYANGFGMYGPISTTKSVNYVATETGANNALSALVADPSGHAILPTPGFIMRVKIAHTLQAGANTMNAGTGAIPIRSHLNPANNIATPYAVGAVITLLYDGLVFQDMSQ